MWVYAMGTFSKDSHAGPPVDIRPQHTPVIPTGDYTLAGDEGLLREIGLLEQRAEALTAEIRRREALEAELVSALARERAARVEAEVAARAKGDFLAVMSHELRTPLNAIGGYVQLIELGVHGALTDGQRAALGRVQQSQRILLSLINQVLDLARIDQGHMEYAIDTIPVSSVVSDVCAMVAPLLQSKQLTCDVNGSLAATSVSPVLVRADRDKLQQILLNLLSNAIKFTPDGGDITVDATVTDAPPVVDIRVRDTGVGIAPEDAARIFAPFVQVAAKGGGTGLGLAISRSLARDMGGDLTVESTVGSGSTFTLSLPRA
jgi:signal transduction histidine kinase